MTINAQNVKKKKRNFSMGRVKDMCMEKEEKFYDLVGDLVNHLSEKDVDDIIFDMWTDYWSKYIPR